ncbi:MAG: hypothetical protein ACR2PY_06540 [Salinispira sp.]
MDKTQLEFAKWLPYRSDRNAQFGGRSFYFFDLDNNIVHLQTEIILAHKKTGERARIRPEVLARQDERIGQSGEYRNYTWLPGEQSFHNFRDCPISLRKRLQGRKENIIEDIDAAVRDPIREWRGPSWDRFYYAVLNRRPVSIITARGHSRHILTKALRYLYRLGYLECPPNILSLYPVTNPAVRKSLGGSISTNVAELKRVALFQSVEQAFKRYGQNPWHRFGISDDDPANINQIRGALEELKKRYPDNAFFIFDSSGDELKKIEIFTDHVETHRRKRSAANFTYDLDF